MGSCGNGGGAGSYNVVMADFSVGLDTCWSAMDAGFGCAMDSVTGLEANRNPHAVWLWNLDGASNAYINR